jgi:phage-related tail protein
VPPGTYQVQLTVGDRTYTRSCEVRKDPRISATQADLDAQFELLTRIRDKLSETHDAINQIRYIRQQVGEWVRRAKVQSDNPSAKETLTEAANALKEKLTAIEEELIQTRTRGTLDALNYPSRLNAKLAALTSVVVSADAAPTQQSYDVFHDLSARIDRQIERLQEVIETDVAALNSLIRTSGIQPILPMVPV